MNIKTTAGYMRVATPALYLLTTILFFRSAWLMFAVSGWGPWIAFSLYLISVISLGIVLTRALTVRKSVLGFVIKLTALGLSVATLLGFTWLMVWAYYVFPPGMIDVGIYNIIAYAALGLFCAALTWFLYRQESRGSEKRLTELG